MDNSVEGRRIQFDVTPPIWQSPVARGLTILAHLIDIGAMSWVFIWVTFLDGSDTPAWSRAIALIWTLIAICSFSVLVCTLPVQRALLVSKWVAVATLVAGGALAGYCLFTAIDLVSFITGGSSELLTNALLVIQVAGITHILISLKRIKNLLISPAYITVGNRWIELRTSPAQAFSELLPYTNVASVKLYRNSIKSGIRLTTFSGREIFIEVAGKSSETIHNAILEKIKVLRHNVFDN